MKKHNTTSPPRLVALLFGAALFGLVSQSALAAGTTAGTSISNTATLAYTVGGVPQTDVVGTSAAFLVDEKVNLTVAGTGVAIPVVPGSTLQVATFTVTNNSNSALDFSLAANQPVGGPAYLGLTDNFDATACIVRVETAGGAGYQDGVDTATFIDELAVDTSKTVYVVCSIPIARVNGDAAIVGLTATAIGTFNAAGYVATPAAQGAAITETAGPNTANVDIVFADVAGSEGDLARNANHSARDVYSVVSATLGVSKTAVLLCDPFNTLANAKNIPGSMTRWSIAITNTGAAAATLTTVADALSATLAHDANLVNPADAATCSSAAGTPESAAGKGFKVTASAARNIGGVAAQTVGYFTTASDADGVEFATPNITATFATILPADGGHASAGLLNAGETVTIIFNTTVQ